MLSPDTQRYGVGSCASLRSVAGYLHGRGLREYLVVITRGQPSCKGISLGRCRPHGHSRTVARLVAYPGWLPLTDFGMSSVTTSLSTLGYGRTLNLDMRSFLCMTVAQSLVQYRIHVG